MVFAVIESVPGAVFHISIFSCVLSINHSIFIFNDSIRVLEKPIDLINDLIAIALMRSTCNLQIFCGMRPLSRMTPFVFPALFMRSITWKNLLTTPVSRIDISALMADLTLVRFSHRWAVSNHGSTDHVTWVRAAILHRYILETVFYRCGHGWFARDHSETWLWSENVVFM